MNTILTNSPPITLYDLCDPTAVKEMDFLADVVRIVSHVYPDYHVFRFCPDVTHEGSVWNPDLAVVDKSLKFWFVIEVETAAHHLEKHVLPQVSAFLQGDFAANTASLLTRAIGVNLQQAETLMAYVPRDVVVISNKIDLVWRQKLGSIGAQFMAIESYRNRITAQTAHRIEGDLIPARRSLGFGQVQAKDQVIKTQAGPFWKNGSYLITGPSGIAEWECVIHETNAWLLKKAGVLEFADGSYVQFLTRVDGSIIVRGLY